MAYVLCSEEGSPLDPQAMAKQVFVAMCSLSLSGRRDCSSLLLFHNMHCFDENIEKKYVNSSKTTK